MGPPAVWLASFETGTVNGQRIAAVEWKPTQPTT
jgi:hypothetical protein